jgi:fused signal recognition particle receptor
MLSFFKRKKKKETTETPDAQSIQDASQDLLEASESSSAEVASATNVEETSVDVVKEVREDVTAPEASVSQPSIHENAPEEAEKASNVPVFDKNGEENKTQIEENAKIPSPAPVEAEPEIMPENPEDKPDSASTAESNTEEKEPPTETKKPGFFSRLKQSLTKTRKGFTESLATLFLGKKEIDEDLMDELEMVLLTADMGVETTDRIIQNLTGQVSRKELSNPEALYEALKIQLRDILHPVEQPLDVSQKPADEPFVILVVGVNGAGKTTTIGKLANRYKQEGKSVMLAAGDTFRAAAVEQLQTWGERNGVPVVAQKTGADSAAVIFDAVQSAKAKGVDVIIADTAGRLHTQSNLMEELKKVKRVISKVLPDAPHEVMLVLDAGTGQNALSQAKLFNDAVGLTGLTLTKLDGTAKGGVIFALANQLQVPMRYIGVGEGIEDLRPFQANAFIEALFDTHETNKA